jgi:hypothetical protein
MNPEQEDFNELRRLLALKRYEQPPPGFFQDFSREVIVRIRAGERIDDTSLYEVLSWEAPWLKRFLNLLDAKPILAGAFGAGVCGLLLAGVLFAEAPADTDSSAPLVSVAPGTVEGTMPLAVANANTSQGPLPVKFSTSMDGALPSLGRDSLFQQVGQEKRVMNLQLIGTSPGNN